MTKDPYKDSPYDSAGMPLSVDQVDYDKKEDVAKGSVKDKYVAPENIAALEFEDPNPLHRKNLLVDRANFNSAVDLPIKDADQKHLKSPEEIKADLAKAAKKAKADKEAEAVKAEKAAAMAKEEADKKAFEEALKNA